MISNTGTGYALYIEDTAADPSPIVIEAGGNLGIGTKAPKEGITVIGSGLWSGDLFISGNDINLGNGISTTILDENAQKLAQTSDSQTTNAWSVDQTSGKVNISFFGDINMQGNSILDVKKITGYLGKWSIDEEGTLMAVRVITNEVITQKLTVGSPEAPTSITVYDKSGKAGCLSIEDVASGAIKVAEGACGNTPMSNVQTPMTPVVESSAFTTGQANLLGCFYRLFYHFAWRILVHFIFPEVKSASRFVEIDNFLRHGVDIFTVNHNLRGAGKTPFGCLFIIFDQNFFYRIGNPIFFENFFQFLFGCLPKIARFIVQNLYSHTFCCKKASAP